MTAPLTREAFAPRASYEGKGGWTDGRLGQAFDLLDAVMREQGDGGAGEPELRDIRDRIENVDILIGYAA